MLRDRARQFDQTHKLQNQGLLPNTGGQGQPASPIYLGGRPYFAIVDGELLTVLGTTDIPGMSPAYWCSDNEGNSAPVSTRETRIFPTAQQAIQALEMLRGNPGSFTGEVGNRLR